MTDSRPGKLRSKAATLQKVLRVKSFVISVDKSLSRALSLQVNWGLEVFCVDGTRFAVAEDVLEKALATVMSPREDTELLLKEVFFEAPDLETPKTRAFLLAADMWDHCVYVASQEEAAQRAAAAFYEVLDTPLTPDADVVLVHGPGSSSEHGFETILSYGIPPQSKDVALPPLLSQIAEEEGDQYCGPRSDELTRMIIEAELVLLEAVALHMSDYAARARAQEEHMLLNR